MLVLCGIRHQREGLVLVQVINLLRFGCVPVGVLDGDAPEAKRETLRARYAAA